MMFTEFILYVRDQEASRDFYAEILNLPPALDVPGMTEFQLNPSTRLGLMPESGIRKILQDALPDPASGSGIPRCELYLMPPEAEKAMERALGAGAKLISGWQPRDWGHEVGYVADLDGHVIAFAKEGI